MRDRLSFAIDDVWSALTDVSRLSRWYREVSGDLRMGGEYRARVFASGWAGTGRVEACEPPRRLQLLSKEQDDHWSGASARVSELFPAYEVLAANVAQT